MSHPYANIIKPAGLILNALQPHCTFCEIAGSIRRQSQFCGDIEIVCVPKTIQTGQDLFGTADTFERDFMFVNAINTIGRIESGNPKTGRMIKAFMMYSGTEYQVDIFIPQAHDLYRQFAIRTGSSEYAGKKIASRWRKLGWVGTPDGLRLESECTGKQSAEGKTVWTCHTKNPTLPPVWKSEREFFEWLKLEYVEPKFRNL